MLSRKSRSPTLVGPALAVVLFAAGCTDKVKDEQDRLKMVRKSGTVEEVCRQARKVAAAALEAKIKEYDELNLFADVDCLTADMNPGRSYARATDPNAPEMTVDNMESVSEAVAAKPSQPEIPPAPDMPTGNQR